MNTALGFRIGGDHHARELTFEQDWAAVRSLGLRCMEYLRQTTPGRVGSDEILRRFLRQVNPAHSRGREGVPLGISRLTGVRGAEPSPLAGVLYFLHPPAGQRAWHIALLLLEPSARGRGLGTAIHEAFATWAEARGAQRLTVTVSEANRQALRFWRQRMRYAEVSATLRQPSLLPFHRSRNLEHRLSSARRPAPWQGLEAA